jgi:hypothetical protein
LFDGNVVESNMVVDACAGVKKAAAVNIAAIAILVFKIISSAACCGTYTSDCK